MFSVITVDDSTPQLPQFVHTPLAIRTQDPVTKIYSRAWEWVGPTDKYNTIDTVGRAICEHMYNESRHPRRSSIEDPLTFSLKDVTEIDPLTWYDHSSNQIRLGPLSALYLHGAVVNARKGQYCFAAVVVQRGPGGIPHLIYVMSQDPASFCNVGPRHYSFEPLIRYQKRVLEHVQQELMLPMGKVMYHGWMKPEIYNLENPTVRTHIPVSKQVQQPTWQNLAELDPDWD